MHHKHSINSQNSVHTVHEDKADLPSIVVKADSIFGACVSMTHFHVKLWIKQQHEVDAASISFHVQQERIFHHQPAAWPAEADLMVAYTVQALDSVTPWPLQDISLPESRSDILCNEHQPYPYSLPLKYTWAQCFAYKPLGPRSETKERGLMERNSNCKTKYNTKCSHFTWDLLCMSRRYTEKSWATSLFFLFC